MNSLVPICHDYDVSPSNGRSFRFHKSDVCGDEAQRDIVYMAINHAISSPLCSKITDTCKVWFLTPKGAERTKEGGPEFKFKTHSPL